MDLVPPIAQPNPQTTLLHSSPPASPTTNVLINNSIPFSTVNLESEDEPLRPTDISRENIRPVASRPRLANSQNNAKHVALNKQHRREYFASRARIVKKPRFNRHLPYKLKPEFSSWEIVYWDGTRQEFTTKNNSLPSQRIVVPLRAITDHMLWWRLTRLRQLSVRCNALNLVLLAEDNPLRRWIFPGPPFPPQKLLRHLLLTLILNRLKSRFNC